MNECDVGTGELADLMALRRIVAPLSAIKVQSPLPSFRPPEREQRISHKPRPSPSATPIEDESWSLGRHLYDVCTGRGVSSSK